MQKVLYTITKINNTFQSKIWRHTVAYYNSANICFLVTVENTIQLPQIVLENFHQSPRWPRLIK